MRRERDTSLNDKYIAVVKLNVKEYVTDEAKIYDNKVLTIEELTVVERERQQNADSTSSAVSSEYIIAQYRKLVKKNAEKNITKADLSIPAEKNYDILKRARQNSESRFAAIISVNRIEK